MRLACLAPLVFFGASVQAQPAWLNGIALGVGPSATVGSVDGGATQAGLGFSVEAGWIGDRVGITLGGTGGFVANTPALWARLGDTEARTEGTTATRSTLATMDAAVEVNLARAGARTVPFVGLSYALPIYATERRDSARRVSASGTVLSPRVGVRHEVSPGLALSASVAAFSGQLDRGFAGEEGSGRAVEIEGSRVRGAHVKIGLVLRPVAWAAALDARMAAREAARASAPSGAPR